MLEQTSDFFFWYNYPFPVYFNIKIILKYISIYNYYKYI